jgi:hypothetical protein
VRTLFVAVLTVLCSSALVQADDKGTGGKLFIKAETNGQQFADPALEDTIKDLKAKHDKFVVVDDEAKADFLLVVTDRQTESKTQLGTQITVKTVHANLSVKDGDAWKPGIKLAGSNAVSWANAAGKVIEDAEKWAKDKGK